MKKLKYSISKNAKTSLFVAIGAFFIGYIAILYVENQLALVASTQDVDCSIALSWMDVIKNVLLVFLSVLPSSLISAFLIEKNNLNDMYRDNINELLYNCDFYKYLNDKQQKKLLNDVDKLVYPNNNAVKNSMITSIKESIMSRNDDFYYEECQAVVTCEIRNNTIIKKIKRVMRIKAYEDREIEQFEFVGTTIEKIANCNCFNIEKIKVNDIKWKENKDYVVTQKPAESTHHKKGGYDTKYSCRAKKRIKLSSTKETVIEIEYQTIVNITDSVFTLRVKEHCKKFSISFKILGQEEYNVFGNAFGFIDDAEKTLNDNGANNISFEFKNWIYKGDGVAIFFQKK